MTSSNFRAPILLQPFTRLPPVHTLYVVTSVLGASANWLTLRYLHTAFADEHLRRRPQPPPFTDDPVPSHGTFSTQDDVVRVVLVSWMQCWEFWKTEARRTVGLSLDHLEQKGTLKFVDGLSSLFQLGPLSAVESSQSSPGTHGPATMDQKHFNSPNLAHVQQVILNQISALKEPHPKARILLILDHPSILLSTVQSITSIHLSQLVLRLRSQVHSSIITCTADRPFTHSAASAADAAYDDIPQNATFAPLETKNAAFLMSCLHQASRTLSCRRLGTGWAEDVHGVLRITRGAIALQYSEDVATGSKEETTEEGEWLYYICPDGSAKVWRRGEQI